MYNNCIMFNHQLKQMEKKTQLNSLPYSERSYVNQEDSIILNPTKQRVQLPITDNQLFYPTQNSHQPLKKKALVTIMVLTILLLAFGWKQIRQTEQKTPQVKQTSPIQLKAESANDSQKPTQKQNIDNQSTSQKLLREKALEKYHPWDLSKEAKESLLNKYKSMPQKDVTTSELMPIVQDREKEILPLLQEFQKTSEVVNYSQRKMTEKERSQYQLLYNLKLALRLEKMEKKLSQQQSFTTNPEGLFSKKQYKITRKQWYDAFEYHSLVGVNISADSRSKEIAGIDSDKEADFRRIAQQQVDYFQSKYETGKYTKELKICLISPGLNNQRHDRYLWNVESVLQQNYSNFRMVIIDDVSTDKTVQLLSKHLKWRNISQDKVTIVKNRKNQKATANIFYATHKYCGLGQIQIVLDSDDELIGRQVFKTLNAIYQKEKLLTIYSNFITSAHNPLNPLHLIGFSRDYLQEDIQKNNFRKPKIRGYSHLRTMLSDNFLLMKPQSLKDWRNEFYWIIYDNAVYQAAMQMSCGKMKYLPQLFLYYNSNTGINDAHNVKTKEQKQQYQNIFNHISQQKSYTCLAVQFLEISQYKL